MKTGSEAFERSNLAPGHKMVDYTNGEFDCDTCEYSGRFKKTGEVTPGNTSVLECPACRTKR